MKHVRCLMLSHTQEHTHTCTRIHGTRALSQSHLEGGTREPYFRKLFTNKLTIPYWLPLLISTSYVLVSRVWGKDGPGQINRGSIR